jgi:Flp pilus assembly pilin Flp
MLRILTLILSWRSSISGSRLESGQTLVEYGILVMLLAIAVIGILTIVGGDVTSLFTSVSSDFQDIADNN